MIVILNVKIFKSKQFKCPLVIKLERKIKKKKNLRNFYEENSDDQVFD